MIFVWVLVATAAWPDTSLIHLRSKPPHFETKEACDEYARDVGKSAASMGALIYVWNCVPVASYQEEI